MYSSFKLDCKYLYLNLKKIKTCKYTVIKKIKNTMPYTLYTLTNLYLPENGHAVWPKNVGAWYNKYEGCSKSIGPLVGKNTIIYLHVWNPNPLQSSLLGDAHTSSTGPAIAGNISGKLLVESAGLSRST